MKVCKGCLQQRPLSEFHRNPSSKDGRDSRCKTCCRNEWKNLSPSKRRQEMVQTRTWDKNNRSHVQRVSNLNDRKRRKIDSTFRLKDNLNVRLGLALKSQNQEKCFKTVALLGCTIEYFKDYIASQFYSGMTWDSYGLHTWHLDHIIPICKFDLSKEEEVKRCFHYSNYQPLLANQNWIKGGR